MYIQQLYTSCLAQAAYYIESDGVAAIVDPLRDVSTYINLANSRNARIRYVLETHFHADFVSGHLDIARQTGASIVFGPLANPNYHAFTATDGDVLNLGNCSIKVLHTPGHTIESCCFLLMDEEGKPHALFSGDTLFIGDVGRPDLMSGNLSAEVLAGQLFDSLQNKIMPLDDNILLYPGHGAGSPCGKNLSTETLSTLGSQKRTNYALQYIHKADFITAVTTDQPVPPPYFFSDAMINKTGYKPVTEVLQKEMKDLSAQNFADLFAKGAKIIDTRSASDFANCHIKGSVHIGLEGMFALWAGTLFEVKEPLLLINSLSNEREPVVRLMRVGFENILGYYDEDLTHLANKGLETASFHNLKAQEVASFTNKEVYQVLDVRTPGEFEQGAMDNKHLQHIPLNELKNRIGELDPEIPVLVYCAGGYRSLIAACLLEQKGFKEIYNLEKGYTEYSKLLSTVA